MFKITFFIGLLLKAWMAAETDPLRTGKTYGLPFNIRVVWTIPGAALLVSLLAEIMLWGSCAWLVMHHYTAWLWIGMAIIGAIYLPNRFKEDRRKSDENFQGPMMYAYVANKISKYPEFLKGGIQLAQAMGSQSLQNYVIPTGKDLIAAALKSFPDSGRLSENTRESLLNDLDTENLQSLPDSFYWEVVACMRSEGIYMVQKGGSFEPSRDGKAPSARIDWSKPK